MVRDPYSVLEISRDATKEEIKAAYRKKAKQYHPDLHPNDPSASEKMNEVNEAYDMLSNPEKYRNRQGESNQRQGAYQQNTYEQRNYRQTEYQQYGENWSQDFWGYGFDDFFGFGSTRQHIPNPTRQPGDSEAIKGIVDFICMGRYDLANQMLQQIVSRERDGRWHYLCSLANYGLGNHIKALEEIKMALQIEPNNLVYQQVYSSINANSRQYKDMGSEYQSAAEGMQRFCMGLCLLNCLCGCCRC